MARRNHDRAQCKLRTDLSGIDGRTGSTIQEPRSPSTAGHKRRTYGDGDRRADADTDGNVHSDANGITHTDSSAYSDANGITHTDSSAYSDANGITHTDSVAHADGVTSASHCNAYFHAHNCPICHTNTDASYAHDVSHAAGVSHTGRNPNLFYSNYV
jgi:hypothetical protein